MREIKDKPPKKPSRPRHAAFMTAFRAAFGNLPGECISRVLSFIDVRMIRLGDWEPGNNDRRRCVSGVSGIAVGEIGSTSGRVRCEVVSGDEDCRVGYRIHWQARQAVLWLCHK